MRELFCTEQCRVLFWVSPTLPESVPKNVPYLSTIMVKSIGTIPISPLPGAMSEYQLHTVRNGHLLTPTLIQGEGWGVGEGGGGGGGWGLHHS